MNNIIDETVMTADAVLGGSGGSGGLDIASGKLSISANAINSSRLAASSVSNTNVSDTAAIAGTKISPNFGSQNITTTGSVSAKNTITNGATNNDFASKVTNTGTTNAYGFLVDAVNSPYALAIRDSSNQYRFRFGGDGTASMGGATGNSFNISSTGNVGVGTTSPSYKLDVNGDIKSRNGWFLGSRGTSGFTALSTAENTLSGGCIIVRDDTSTYNTHGVEFYANSEERMRIQSNGNVGIGKTNPSTILDVNGTVTATAFSGPLTGNVTGNVTGDVTGNATSADYATRAALGPVNGTFTQDHTADSNKIYVGGFGSGKGNGILCQRADSTNGTALTFNNESGAQKGSIVITSTGTNFNGTSDYRLKEDLQQIVSPLDKLNNLNPVNFKWIGSNERTDGFIAHEVQSVVPNAVCGDKDAVDADGNPIYQQVDQSKLIPILVGAIQELSRKVAELESR
jgi:hypothetical protein